MRFVPAQRCTVMLQVFYCIELYQESIRQRNRTVYRNSNARIVFLPLFVKNSYKFEGLLFSLLSQIYTVSIELVKNICAISQVCVAKGRSKHAETHGRVFSQFFALPTRPYTAFFAGNSANARVSYHHISVSPFTTYKTHISQRIYYIFFALPNRHCKYRIDQKRVHNFLVCVLPRPKVYTHSETHGRVFFQSFALPNRPYIASFVCLEELGCRQIQSDYFYRKTIQDAFNSHHNY